MAALGMILILAAYSGECRGWAYSLREKGLGEGSEGIRVRAQTLDAGFVVANAHSGPH